MALYFYIVHIYLDSTAYPNYLARFALGPGSVGSTAEEDTPLARSITLEIQHFDQVDQVGGRNYYELESGEIVIGRVNWDAKQEIYREDGDCSDGLWYRLPVSRWIPLEADVYRSSFLTRGDYYADMRGDLDAVLSEGDFKGRHPLVVKGGSIFPLSGLVMFFFLNWRLGKTRWFS